MAHLQRGRARGDVPGEVPGGRWAGERAAISRLPSANIVYLCRRAYTLLPLPQEVRTFNSPAARTPRVGGWTVLAPPPRTRAGGGLPPCGSKSRTRPVSCDSLRREGGQGCLWTGSALEHRPHGGLNQRGDALLPKIDLCAPRTTRLFLSLVGPAPAGPPFRLSARPRLELQYLLMRSRAGRGEGAFLIAEKGDVVLRREMRQLCTG